MIPVRDLPPHRLARQTIWYWRNEEDPVQDDQVGDALQTVVLSPRGRPRWLSGADHEEATSPRGLLFPMTFAGRSIDQFATEGIDPVTLRIRRLPDAGIILNKLSLDSWSY